MRMLTISNVLLDENSGSGYVILGYVRGLRARGHSVDLLGPEDFLCFKKIKKAKRLRLFLGYSKVMLLARFRSYDFVECYGAEAWFATRLWRPLPGQRPMLVAHSNGIEPHRSFIEGKNRPESIAAKIFNRLSRPEWAFRYPDGIVAVSDFDLKWIQSETSEKPPFTAAIANPLPDTFLNRRVNFSRSPVIGFCGNWIERKGVGYLREAIDHILRRFPEATFEVVGHIEANELKKEFSESVRRQIMVRGHVSREQLPEWYASCAIVVLPSIYESFGLVAAESMACGCALLATRTGFMDSLDHLKNAYLVNSRSAREIEAGIAWLLDHPEERIRIAMAGWAAVQNLEWNQAVDRLEALYLEWLLHHD